MTFSWFIYYDGSSIPRSYSCLTLRHSLRILSKTLTYDYPIDTLVFNYGNKDDITVDIQPHEPLYVLETQDRVCLYKAEEYHLLSKTSHDELGSYSWQPLCEDYEPIMFKV